MVDKGIRNFIWVGDTRKKKLFTVAWIKVYSPMAVGGLGLRSLKLMNKAALLNRSPSARYFKPSIWHGIRDNWVLANLNSIWLIGDELQINFWRDNWIGDSLLDILGIPQ
ncbi:hypothetical protein Lal_00035958 [Lupinus albus]|nr:hypothetical protein Lal_00035958 [Lupinus albus]